MKKAAIQIEYSGKIVTSKFEEFTEEEIESLKTVCSMAVSGSLKYIELEENGNLHYFSKDMLTKSKMTIVFE